MEKYDASMEYVVLEHLSGIDKGYRFWTTNSGPEEKLGWSHDENGKRVLAYKPVWFTNSSDEAIRKCGEASAEEHIDWFGHHMLKMQKTMLVSALYEANEALNLPLESCEDLMMKVSDDVMITDLVGDLYNETPRLKQGTRVEYTPQSDIKITGEICGIASNDQPIIGIGYIIKIDDGQKIFDYPYTHMKAWSVHLKVI